MKISYTGNVELRQPQQKKIEVKFAKLGKLLDGKHEREAHVVVVQHQQRAAFGEGRPVGFLCGQRGASGGNKN